MIKNITYDNLVYHPQAITPLARMWCSVFGRIWSPDVEYSVIEKELQTCTSHSIPAAYLALDKDKPVGYAALFYKDWVRPDLMPWVTDLMVHPHYQSKGIGKKLLEHCKKHAGQLGYNYLYLCSSDEAIIPYYEKIGWHAISQENYNDHDVHVMRYLL